MKNDEEMIIIFMTILMHMQNLEKNDENVLVKISPMKKK
jgi:hypothetical protein